MDRLRHIRNSATVDWTIGVLPPANTPNNATIRRFDPDSDYLNVFVRSARLVRRRRGRFRIYGLVQARVSLVNSDVSFMTAVVPTELRGVDQNNADRVIVMNHRAAGPTPYRGGDVRLEVGRFAVRGGDLTEPYLQVLEAMTAAVALDSVALAALFTEPLRMGFDLLTGADDRTALEVGLYRTLDSPTTGWLVFARLPRGAFKVDELSVADDNVLLQPDGKALTDAPYVLLELEATKTRRDWGAIPELGRRYRYLQDEVRGLGRPDMIKMAFGDWARAMKTSDDLHFADADAIVERGWKRTEGILTGPVSGANNVQLPAAEDL